MSRDNNSANSIVQCHVLIVKATIINSVRIKAVNEIATMCMKSSSNRNNAPNMMIPPERRGEERRPC